MSPVLHRAGYAACALTGWRYDSAQLTARSLPAFVGGLDEQWRGLSLTMPLKVAALEVADTVTELAATAGAANTLYRDELGRWVADNTDVHGLVEATRTAGQVDLATIVGSGATARSAVLALAARGVGRVRIAARNPGTARALVAVAEGQGLQAEQVELLAWAREPGSLVISTVPAGAGRPVASALADQLGRRGGAGVDRGSRPVTVLDVVYDDWPTPVARAASQVGFHVVSGIVMLAHQAARQFTLFTGLPAPVGAMLAAVDTGGRKG